jgi:hypothetical protein
VVDSSDPLVTSSTKLSAQPNKFKRRSGALALGVNVAIVGPGNFFRKYRVALAFRPLKGENFGNFFREKSGSLGQICDATPAVTKRHFRFQRAAVARKTFNPAT